MNTPMPGRKPDPHPADPARAPGPVDCDMARIHPHGWRQVEALGAAQREIETLARLAAGLPDDYTVFHGVHWTRLDKGCSVYGEIDFAIVSPSARVLLIEQKSGLLTETEQGLVKQYGKIAKNVPMQIARNAEALQARFSRAHAGDKLRLETMLYCPDYTVRHRAIAGIEAERIIDASRRDTLIAAIRAALPLDEPDAVDIAAVFRFFGDLLDLVPEIGAVAGTVEALYTRLSGGLAEWGRRIECDPFRLRVVGTAGSGKTQLAMAVLRDGAQSGRRSLYVCYNRPLADHVSRIAPEQAEVATYHQLCERVARSIGQRPDFGQPGAFAALEHTFAQAVVEDRWRFDDIVVDEGQDFDAAWRDPLLRLLADRGRAWWLEDPMQNLYERPPVELPGWVTLHADTNYRSPGDILDHLNRLLGPGREVRGASPLQGSDVQIIDYEGPAGLVDATKSAITQCIGAGFPRTMIAVLTFRGREHSALASYTQLGPHKLRAPTGRYDLLGSPEYTEGELLLDSVYRFKGQSAPCVILTEIDFEALDERVLRRLFVGATRATMKLVLVVSKRAAQAMLDRLG